MLLFNNFAFFIFLGIVLFLYFIVPKKFQWVILLVASYGFYISFSIKFAFFILLSTLTIYFAAMYFAKINNEQKFNLLLSPDLTTEQKKKYKTKCKRKKKTVFVLTILLNVGILVFLKYFNFFGDSINSMLGWFNADPVVPRLNLILPLGISFYTFQSLGYLIDCYWGKITYQENLFKFALFISFFPQVVQGPISRYSELGEQLTTGHKFNYDKFISGAQLMIWGLCKKMIIADGLSLFVNNVFLTYADHSGAIVVFGIVFYLIQDYADFSGCIDIARGAAECMGIEMPQNFERPYFSLSIPEYWRRWHMTLGTWFKDYIFYPISISKFSLKLGKVSKKFFGKWGKNIPAIFGLMVVWLTTGLWHGASWNYVLWGAYYGIIIICGIILKPVFEFLISKLHINRNSWWWKGFSWFRTIWLLCVGRIIFRAASIPAAWAMFVKTFRFFDISYLINEFSALGADMTLAVALIVAVVLLAVDLYKEFHKDVSLRQKIRNQKLFVSWPIYIVLILCIFIFGAYGVNFNPADFIYMQF